MDFLLNGKKTNSQRYGFLMGYAINYFGNGKVVITKKGTIRVGEITMQRKGGDGGRTTARMLQFKINPAKLFET